MRVLAHLSDLHFGADVPEIAQGLLESLADMKPDLVVVTGDLTQRATIRQFQQAREFLNQIPFPKIVIPGNHDVSLYNVFRRFALALERYNTYITHESSPFYTDSEIAVLGINTARSLTWKNGRISIEQIGLIRSHFCQIPADRFRVLATHHPFLAPPGREKEAVVGRAKKMFLKVHGCSPDMALAGHFHRSYYGGSHSVYTAQEDSTLIIQAGTAISKRTRMEQNAYNIIHIDGGIVRLRVLMWNGKGFANHRKKAFRRDKGLWQELEA